MKHLSGTVATMGGGRLESSALGSEDVLPGEVWVAVVFSEVWCEVRNGKKSAGGGQTTGAHR